MDPYSGPERRVYPRINTAFMVSYRKPQAKEYDMSSTKNISRGGMLFTTSEQLRKNSTLELLIRGPFSLDKLGVTAIVQDSQEVLKSSIYNTRVKFLDAEQSRLTELEEYIRRRLRLISQAKHPF